MACIGVPPWFAERDGYRAVLYKNFFTTKPCTHCGWRGKLGFREGGFVVYDTTHPLPWHCYPPVAHLCCKCAKIPEEALLVFLGGRDAPHPRDPDQLELRNWDRQLERETQEVRT